MTTPFTLHNISRVFCSFNVIMLCTLDLFFPFGVGAWVDALRTLPLASQESCAAMEFYHNQLKIRLLNEKDINVYQRADWLVDKIGTKVHSYYWLDECSDKDDFARYWKNEWMSGLTSWRKALKIPDADVVMEDGCAKVKDEHAQDKAYIVWNAGSMLSICDCYWAKEGNLCEHILKVFSICRNQGSVLPSISLLQYHQALKSMLHCPPFDSLIRDHAVSLAVSVQKQLNMLLDKESIQTAGGSNEKRIVIDIHQQNSRVASAGQDEALVCERQVIKDILSRGAACGVSHITGHADMDVDETVSSNNALLEKKTTGLITIGNELSASKNGAVFDVINEDICKDNNGMNVDPPPLDIVPSMEASEAL